MTDKQTLLDLANRVKAGEHLFIGVLNKVLTKEQIKLVFKSINTGSLDAAKALHDAVLPGWYWKVETSWANGCPKATVADWSVEHTYYGFSLKGNNEAAAWVAAILRAKANAK